MSKSATLLENTLCTGAAASVATAVAAAVLGETEKGKPLGPLNAVSHILWGDEAAKHNEASLKYTATGLLLNTAAVTMWAGLYEMLHDRRQKKDDLAGTLLDGALVSAAAYITDYCLVPKRLTPGFELKLSTWALLGIYGVLALSFAAGSKMHGSDAA